jgi:aspartokinase
VERVLRKAAPAPFVSPDERLLTVVKIGGSVFTDASAYRRAATSVARRLADCPWEQLVVVVSAEYGATDALLSIARDLSNEPDPASLDLLWSTAELRSAALLALALQGAGVAAAAANVHQTGITQPSGAVAAAVRPLRLRALLAAHDVVVVPGFLARRDGDGVVTLGRGGSDLSAVLLATGLGAASCELIKDVPGYFSSDPNVDPSARHLPVVSYAAAIEMAADGCALVQARALETARDAGLRLVVRALEGGQSSTVTDRPARGRCISRRRSGSAIR